ncbi:MAG: hypothetical protein IPJ34_39270 [Myxococcales bacterium]|nr:hypothetical protein [Myxococcales bacterium]
MFDTVPERTSLHAPVREQLQAFHRHTSEHYAGELPVYFRRAFERYLRCGLPEHGFRSSPLRRLRPAGRASCAGRIMASTSAPGTRGCRVPLRQWVLTQPFELRARAAKEPALVAGIDRILFREVER